MVMKADAVNRWLTLGANLGVLAGIILLVIELSQNHDMMRSQIRYQVFQDQANYNLAIATDRGLVEVMYRAAAGEELSGPDRVQNLLRLIAYFRIQENVHFQMRQGLLDQNEFEGVRTEWRGFVRVSAATMEAWCTIRRSVSEGFRTDMDLAFENLDCAP